MFIIWFGNHLDSLVIVKEIKKYKKLSVFWLYLGKYLYVYIFRCAPFSTYPIYTGQIVLWEVINQNGTKGIAHDVDCCSESITVKEQNYLIVVL